jgi:uncharacterized protein YuzE
MALAQIDTAQYIQLAKALQNFGEKSLWMSYDGEADVMYINFSWPPQPATNSEATDDDIVIRYQDNEVIGITVLSVSTR